MAAARHLRAQVEALIADQLWDSAALLGGFLASANDPSDPTSPGERAAHVALYADALFGKGEHRRAMHFYRQALQLNRLAPVPVVSAAVATPGASSRSTPAPGTPGAPVTPARGGETPAASNPEPRAHPHVDEATLKYKLGRCHVALREWRAALAEFETIPARARTLPITLALANAYRRTGYERAAVACYKECLRMNPHVIEALVALAELRVDAAEIRAFLPEAARDAAAAAGYPASSGTPRRRKTAGGDFAEDDAFGDGDRDERGDERAGPVPGGASNAAAAASSVPGDADAAANATRWMWHFAEGHASLAGGDGEAAVAHFTTLDRSFEDTHHVVLSLARSETLHERAIEAKRLYARCRDVDPHALDGMDGYAELLYTRFADDDRGYTGGGIMSHAADADAHMGGFGVLSTGFGFPGEMGPSAGLARLARDLSTTDSDRPESWAASAMYWSSKGDSTRALDHAERALRADDRHAGALLVKGHVCLSLRRADAAASAFRRAAALAPSVVSYAGLVASYVLQRRLKEAMVAAKEAIRIAPNSAKATALLGDVHRRSIDGLDRARKAYEQSLRVDSSDAGVTTSLADVLAELGRADEAQRLLRRHMETHPAKSVRARVALHCKLGTTLSRTRALADALGQFQAALAEDPDSQEARRGLHRVERLMKGQDPDAPDEDEEDDEDPEGDIDGRDEDEEGSDLFD